MTLLEVRQEISRKKFTRNGLLTFLFVFGTRLPQALGRVIYEDKGDIISITNKSTLLNYLN